MSTNWKMFLAVVAGAIIGAAGIEMARAVNGVRHHFPYLNGV